MRLDINRAMADFDHPLEMLGACHERIEGQCETLHRLAEYLPRHGSDAEAQQAASNVMRYFDSAGRHHREDEEQNLFPAMLRAARGEAAQRIALLTRTLLAEHETIERAWLVLRDTLERIAHGGAVSLDRGEVERFCRLYRTHMALEEAHLFPLAETLLEGETITTLGQAMAWRRGVRSVNRPPTWKGD
ncbi:MAG TPA: hemerythrin domain-containing protein [Burkholderiales bacterium]|nr:hemerythrin domain-containing protein [Burkholderiales bacterium]